MLGLDLFAIKGGNNAILEEIMQRCENCDYREVCAADVKREPNNPVLHVNSTPESGHSTASPFLATPIHAEETVPTFRAAKSLIAQTLCRSTQPL